MSTLGTLELAARNLSWMGGNTFLAWSAVLFALHLRGSARQQRVAAVVLVVVTTSVLAGRLAIRGVVAEHTARAILLVALVGTAAALWSWRARAGDRWARVVGYVGVLAFAPNAPYVLTDLFHHIQDVRLSQLGLGGAVLFAIQYGWFLTFGAAAWIALLALARDWLRRHRSRLQPEPLLVLVSGVMAFGIYLGRIERFHSWHPLRDPGYFLERVGIALSSPGPLAFTLTWWLVVLLVGVGGLRLADRVVAAGRAPLQLLVALSISLSGALLLSTPLVDDAYREVGVDQVASATLPTTIFCIVVGLATCVAGALRLRTLTRLQPASSSRRATVAWVVATLLVVPVASAALVAASTAQWYAQFRGLCEYSPNPTLHGDSCPRD